VLLVGELVERLLAQPEGGVQAVDLKSRGHSYWTLSPIRILRFLVQMRLPHIQQTKHYLCNRRHKSISTILTEES
jgi:hypothetical protein